ncbi:MAG TPA: ABC transporter permease, partial [Vicinamibacterales bacterium]|nr:ABC transporter permease [Vicinamibacterales bacterium]
MTPIDWRAYVRSKLPPLDVTPSRESDIVEELALQLELIYERQRRAGASHMAALAAADEEVPSWSALARTITAIAPGPRRPTPVAHTSGGLMNGVMGDLRSALRNLRRTPAFTIVAIVTLAVGLGMATAAFSVIDTILIKPLRFKDPGRLVVVHATVPPDNRDTNEITFPDAMDLARETQAFKSVALVMPFSGTATALDPPERVTGYNVTTSMFDTLGVRPALGRGFTSGESAPGRNNVVVLGHGFWTRLGSRPDIIGQTLVLDDVPCTIVGVMPADFRIEVLSVNDAVYRPMPPDLAAAPRTFRGFRVIARLQDGATIEQATSVAQAVGERLASQYPDSNRGRTFTLSLLQNDVVRAIRPALFLIAGLVVLVLLIAAVNLTNLLLARAIAQAREVAVRAALGAGVWRLARASLVEASVLAALGALAAGAVASAILSALVTMPGVTMPRLIEIGLDWRAAGALGLTAIGAAIAVGAVPFLLHRRLHDTAALRTGHQTAGRVEHRIRSILVCAQTALAFILLAATALLAISLQRLLAVPSGFDAGVATMRVGAPASRYPTREVTTQFFNSLVDDIAAQPGIAKAGFVSILPLSGNTGSMMTVQGREDLPMAQRPEVGWMWASPGYFDAMGMPIVRGRGFAPSDLESASHVTVISAELARRHFAGDDPIGKRVYFGGVPATGVPE